MYDFTVLSCCIDIIGPICIEKLNDQYCLMIFENISKESMLHMHEELKRLTTENFRPLNQTWFPLEGIYKVIAVPLS